MSETKENVSSMASDAGLLSGAPFESGDGKAETDPLATLKEGLDIVPPGSVADEDAGAESDAEDPSIPAESEADYEALLAKGWTIEESRAAVKTGLARKILGNTNTPAQPEAVEPDSAAGSGDEPEDSPRIKALEAQIRALEERVGRSPDATDDLILSEKIASVFGEDRWVQPDSEHARNRMRVKDAVDTLKAGLRAKGKAVPPDATLVRQAIRMEFGDELIERAREPLAKRKEQFTARPTARPSRDDIPGEDLARRNLRENIRKVRSGN